MASFTITIGPHTVTKTVSAGDLTRFVAAVRGTYATAAEPIATDALAAAKYFDQVFNGAKDLTKRFERDAAAATAANAVTDIAIT